MTGEARYSVGIDLGTTNSAMACADLTGEGATAIEVLAIAQLVNAGEVSEGSLLPSFLYVAGELACQETPPSNALREEMESKDLSPLWELFRTAHRLSTPLAQPVV